VLSRTRRLRTPWGKVFWFFFSKKNIFLPLPDLAQTWAAHMREGETQAAWRISDAVLARRAGPPDDPSVPYHNRFVWDGTPPNGLPVLVRCYHGLGDVLQFLRFLPALRARAASLTLEVQPALLPLLAGTQVIDRLHAFDPAHPLPRGPCDMEIMELAHVLRANTADISAPVPYLACPEHAPFHIPPGSVALAWQAGGWDPARSIPLPLLLAAVHAPGRALISLQRGAGAGEATHPAFLNQADNNLHMARTAALICAAACVVTVDTMVAHLAGALGRPAYLLLKHTPDWRWPLRGPSTPWYPSLTLLHQASPGDWRAPVAGLASLLRIA